MDIHALVVNERLVRTSKIVKMGSNKRKGDEVTSAGVIVTLGGGGGDESDNRISQMSTTLQSLRSRVRDSYDPFLLKLQGIENHNIVEESKLQESSKTIQGRLISEIQMAKDACQHESAILQEVQSQLSNLENRRTALHQDVESLKEHQSNLQEKIALFQEEASQEIEAIDQVEEERKRQVPRLKTQLSLYATTTGIKWEFDSDNSLTGQVVRAKLERWCGSCRFSRSNH
jgi:chromosome segregation ATPase